MNKFFAVTVLVFAFVMPSARSAEQAAPLENTSSHRDWHFFANISYSSRTLDGSITETTAIANDVFGDLVATGDSMNLDTSDTFMYTLAAQYKKWRVGLNYMPTSFSGQGYAIVTLTGNQAGVLAKTQLNTDIDIDLLLGKLTYDIIQTQSSRFGVGVGLGRTQIDLNIIPQVGNSIIYKGDQPFGFLNLYMANNYQRFLYGFSFNAISASFTGVEVDYSDYTIDLGYRLSDKEIKWDLVGGYRQVNFSIDIEDGQNMYKAITHLQGPFIGVSVFY
ncbi:MAG: hypothetical protein R3354_02215 [Thiohalomonadales bacterium]|nr:hypothetical protein [Thiohalomonadales bacterium]